MTMVVSEIKVDTVGNDRDRAVERAHAVARDRAADDRPRGHAAELSVGATGTNLVMGTVTYAYTPPVIGEAVGTITIQETIYLALRQWSCMALNVGH